ncbi:MAG: bifunctional metallophosphatase/5'-nucleotidase [Oscillospiraceae bacterium]|nr:bifunctional metallophosphatase/5'-nucleotidase [Oscillospiraceae bacterium]
MFAFFLLAATLALAAAALAEPENVNLRVMFTNDIHGHALPGDTDWGLARFAAVARQLNADLILDAGDLYHGLPFATLDSGGGMADAARAVGFDAMTVGNHDWSYGRNQLLSLEARSGVPILTANVVDDKSGKPFFSTRYLIKEIRGVKVGVFGVIDPAIQRATAASILDGLTYIDAVETARTVADELRALGCDIVICLTHTANRTQIADRVPTIDIVITGHNQILSMERVNNTFVAESGWALQTICYIDIIYNAQSRRITEILPIAMTPEYFADVLPDPDVAAVIDEISARFEPILSEIAGNTPVRLEGAAAIIRSEETNLSRVVTDAYLYATGAEISLENSAAMRATIEPGDITFGEIAAVSPFGNYLVVKRIAGRAIAEALERSADIFTQARLALELDDSSLWPDNDGSGLHVGGISFYYDNEMPEGRRVWGIMVGGEPLDPDRLYTVAMSNFIAKHDEYPTIRDAETLFEMYSCEEAIRRYIQEVGVDKSIGAPRMSVLQYKYLPDASDGLDVVIIGGAAAPQTAVMISPNIFPPIVNAAGIAGCVYLLAGLFLK